MHRRRPAPSEALPLNKRARAATHRTKWRLSSLMYGMVDTLVQRDEHAARAMVIVSLSDEPLPPTASTRGGGDDMSIRDDLERGHVRVERLRAHLAQFDRVGRWGRWWYQRLVHEQFIKASAERIYGSAYGVFPREIAAFLSSGGVDMIGKDLTRYFAVSMGRRSGKTESVCMGCAAEVVTYSVRVGLFATEQKLARHQLLIITNYIIVLLGAEEFHRRVERHNQDILVFKNDEPGTRPSSIEAISSGRKAGTWSYMLRVSACIVALHCVALPYIVWERRSFRRRLHVKNSVPYR